VVRIDPPPPSRPPDPLIYILAGASALLRLYRPQPYGSSGCGCRYEGLFSRFDHHCYGQLRGIHYSATTFSAYVVELFGDTGLIEPQGCQLAVANNHAMTMASSGF
jgi:hypothetical protein